MEEPAYNPDSPAATTTIVYQYKLVNCPGKTIVGSLIEYPPNGATPPHRHGGASVSAYGIRGSILNKMNDAPMKVVEQGGSWYEAPGCHHRISANASATEPAAFFVTFLVDSDLLQTQGPSVLVQIDEEYREAFLRKMGQ
ncbi:Putative Cupin domain protein [Aspergillus calidoustus]|uniref:Putative Cupin domain protein n=1 Tax=Aspergillus calidoustus TaxID=454130 RepID=A0A0U5G2V3_ASPCI|nr:Putative Cupin domain protein [Aspergillus calidoustus]